MPFPLFSCGILCSSDVLCRCSGDCGELQVCLEGLGKDEGSECTCSVFGLRTSSGGVRGAVCASSRLVKAGACRRSRTASLGSSVCRHPHPLPVQHMLLPRKACDVIILHAVHGAIFGHPSVRPSSKATLHPHACRLGRFDLVAKLTKGAEQLFS